MAISEVSSGTSLNQASSPQTNFRQLFQQLGQALKSGNLEGAQQAYETLTQNAPNSSQSGQGQLSQDFNALGDALQSNDLTKAQEAFKKLQQDLQSARHSHHHRHHKGTGDSQDATVSATNAGSSNGDDDALSSGRTIDVTT